MEAAFNRLRSCRFTVKNSHGRSDLALLILIIFQNSVAVLQKLWSYWIESYNDMRDGLQVYYLGTWLSIGVCLGKRGGRTHPGNLPLVFGIFKKHFYQHIKNITIKYAVQAMLGC